MLSRACRLVVLAGKSRVINTPCLPDLPDCDPAPNLNWKEKPIRAVDDNVRDTLLSADLICCVGLSDPNNVAAVNDSLIFEIVALIFFTVMYFPHDLSLILLMTDNSFNPAANSCTIEFAKRLDPLAIIAPTFHHLLICLPASIVVHKRLKVASNLTIV